MTASSQDLATCGSTSTTSSLATSGRQSVFLISSSSSSPSPSPSPLLQAVVTSNHCRHETSAREKEQSKRVQEKVAQISQSQAEVLVVESTDSNKLRTHLASNSSDSAISSSSSSSTSSSSSPSSSSVVDEDNVSSTSSSVIESEVFHCNNSQQQSEAGNGEERTRGEQVSSSPSSPSSGTSQALLLLQASLPNEEADDGYLVVDSPQDQRPTSLVGSSENDDDDNNNSSPSKAFPESDRLSRQPSSSGSLQRASQNNSTEFLANQSSRQQQQQATGASCSVAAHPTPEKIDQSASFVYTPAATVIPPVVSSDQIQFQQQQNAYYNFIHHHQHPSSFIQAHQAVPHFPSAIYTATPQSQHQSGAILAASQYHHHPLHQPPSTFCELAHQHQQPVYYYYPYHHHQQQQQQARGSVDALGHRQIDCEQKTKAIPTKIARAPIGVGGAESSISGSFSPKGTNVCQIKAPALADKFGFTRPETNLSARSVSKCAQADDKDHHHQFEGKLVAAVNGSIDDNGSSRNGSSSRASNASANDASNDKKPVTSSSFLESTQLQAGGDHLKGEQQDGNKTKLVTDVHSEAQEQHEKNVKKEQLEVLTRQPKVNRPCSQASSSSSVESALPSRPESSVSSAASSRAFMSCQQDVRPELQPSTASTSNFGYYHDHYLLYQQQQQHEYATYLAQSAQPVAANAARYLAECGPAHPAYYMEHLAPSQAAIDHNQYSQQQHYLAAHYSTFVGRHYMHPPAPIHAAPIHSLHPAPAPVLLVGPAGGRADKSIDAHYYHQQSPYSPAYYHLNQPATATMRSQLFPYFGLPPTTGELSLVAIQHQQQQAPMMQMIPPTLIYDVSMQRCHQQLVGHAGNMMAPQVALQPVIAFNHQQFKMENYHQYHHQQQQQQRRRHSNLIPLLPIDAQPASTRQAYGMDKVWQDEFERLISQLISSIAWSLEEVESVPNIRNSPNIIDYRGRYIVKASSQPGEEEEDIVDSASDNASQCAEDQVDSAADEYSNTSADSEGDIGEDTMINSQEDGEDEKEEGDTDTTSETDEGKMSEERNTTHEAELLSQDAPRLDAESKMTTDEQITSSGETESDCDSGALVNSIGCSGSETCSKEPLALSKSLDNSTPQQENSLENDESNKQQGSLSVSGRKFPTRFRMFIDSAKVRFCCDHCGHGWTSMKGRVVFWYELFELVGDENLGQLSSTNYTNLGESYEEAGGSGNLMIGYCSYKLFGQQCDVCKIEDRFERPMWYPEEVSKVLNNLYNKIGQIYFGFKMPAIDKQRRAGKPKTSHNSSLCQACHDGVCTDRK